MKQPVFRMMYFFMTIPSKKALKIGCKHLLAPKASEASWGLSYFCQGVLSGYCCMCVRVVTVMCEREVTVMESPIGGLPKCRKFTCSGVTF